MCKVMMFTNLSKIRSNKNLVETCQVLLSSQRDGFGYVYETEGSVMSGQRTNDIDSFEFNSSSQDLFIWSEGMSQDSSNLFGTPDKPIIGAGMFHGRISTNNKALINVHPLTFNDKSYLIHNGVVTNTGPAYRQITSNDTEHLLHYMERGQGIQDIAKHLTGYYAFGYMRDSRLTIARDAIAPLYSSWISDLETFIFATTEDLISGFCEAFEYSFTKPQKMKSDTCLIFEGNNLLSLVEFKSRGYGMREASLSSLSLGYSLSGGGNKWTESSIDDVTGFMDEEEESYLSFIAQNITKQDYIELDKTQIGYNKFLKLSNKDKSRCEIFNVHGENLLDLWYNENRREKSA